MGLSDLLERAAEAPGQIAGAPERSRQRLASSPVAKLVGNQDAVGSRLEVLRGIVPVSQLLVGPSQDTIARQQAAVDAIEIGQIDLASKRIGLERTRFQLSDTRKMSQERQQAARIDLASKRIQLSDARKMSQERDRQLEAGRQAEKRAERQRMHQAIREVTKQRVANEAYEALSQNAPDLLEHFQDPKVQEQWRGSRAYQRGLQWDETIGLIASIYEGGDMREPLEAALEANDFHFRDGSGNQLSIDDALSRSDDVWLVGEEDPTGAWLGPGDEGISVKLNPADMESSRENILDLLMEPLAAQIRKRGTIGTPIGKVLSSATRRIAKALPHLEYHQQEKMTQTAIANLPREQQEQLQAAGMFEQALEAQSVGIFNPQAAANQLLAFRDRFDWQHLDLSPMMSGGKGIGEVRVQLPGMENSETITLSEVADRYSQPFVNSLESMIADEQGRLQALQQAASDREAAEIESKVELKRRMEQFTNKGFGDANPAEVLKAARDLNGEFAADMTIMELLESITPSQFSAWKKLQEQGYFAPQNGPPATPASDFGSKPAHFFGIE